MGPKLSIRLWGIINKESQDTINYQIAEQLLLNIFQITDTTSKALAELCHVSKPSISRFYKELGYDSYFEFRQDLHQYHASLDKTSSYQGSRSLGLVHEYLDKCKKYIDILEKNMNEIEINELVQIIAKSSKVYLMGHLQSGSVALNLQYNLFTSKKSTHTYVELNQQKEIFSNLTGRECIIVFSASGNFFRDYFEKPMLENIPKGSNIYLITASPEKQNIPRVTQISCGTAIDMAASNVSLELVANMIALKYENYISQ